MDFQAQLNQASLAQNLPLLAKQVVEGYVNGMHKSPFHGFSSEFSEHKTYNAGESTRHIDWKLFARTDKLYTKRYEEETNLRCHIILDNSASMHYPKVQEQHLGQLNKLGFATLAIASLMDILKRQRDAVGLSIYGAQYQYYSPEKSSERHHQMLLAKLSEVLQDPSPEQESATYTYLHQIAEKIHRRSLIFLFTDMFQTAVEDDKLFEALRHLKYNKHEVVLFQLMDHKTELLFDFDNTPKRFVDVETGNHIDLYADNVKESYQEQLREYRQALRLKCAQYRIQYVDVNIGADFKKVLDTYMVSRQKNI